MGGSNQFLSLGPYGNCSSCKYGRDHKNPCHDKSRCSACHISAPKILLDYCKQHGSKICNYLKHRSKKTENTLSCPADHILLQTPVQSDLLTDFKSFQHILLHLAYRLAPIHPYAAFKVKIETPVIQIYGSHHGKLVITDKVLCMDKPRGIFIDSYPCADQLFVIRLRQQKHHLFIWY